MIKMFKDDEEKLRILKIEYEKEHRNLERYIECTMKIIVINKKIENEDIKQTINKLLNELEK